MADEPRWEDIFSTPAPGAEGGPATTRKAAREAERSQSSRPRNGREPQDARRTSSSKKSSRSRKSTASKKRRRWLGWLIAVVVIFGLVGGATGYVWLNFEPQVRKVLGWELPPPDYVGTGSGKANVVIVSGDTGTEVTRSLLAAGVIKNFDTFYTLLLAQKPAVQFFPGYYVLSKKMSSEAALKAIQDPKNRVEHTALIQEGKTAEQIYTILNTATDIPLADFETAAKDFTALGIPQNSPNVEGYLFPATYHFDPGVTAPSVLKVLVDRTFQSLDAAGVLPKDRARVLTIASLIQREAGTKSEDFYKVSRVIQNRLADGMRLQFDSTAHYGYAWKHGERVNGGVFSTSAELKDDNPYNTYVIPGLPQGPIGAAGDLAIDAAIHPVPGKWLYFVTVNLDTGETVFSETISQHNAAVRQLQQWCRTSKSPNCG